MFQVVARHRELIFFLSTSPKCDLSEVDKVMVQGLECLFEFIFGILTITKCDVVEVEKAMFQGLAWHLQLIFRPLEQPKMRLG